jgi:hypothetical protein
MREPEEMLYSRFFPGSCRLGKIGTSSFSFQFLLFPLRSFSVSFSFSFSFFLLVAPSDGDQHRRLRPQLSSQAEEEAQE